MTSLSVMSTLIMLSLMVQWFLLCWGTISTDHFRQSFHYLLMDGAVDQLPATKVHPSWCGCWSVAGQNAGECQPQKLAKSNIQRLKVTFLQVWHQSALSIGLVAVRIGVILPLLPATKINKIWGHFQISLTGLSKDMYLYLLKAVDLLQVKNAGDCQPPK